MSDDQARAEARHRARIDATANAILALRALVEAALAERPDLLAAVARGDLPLRIIFDERVAVFSIGLLRPDGGVDLVEVVPCDPHNPSTFAQPLLASLDSGTQH